jgi:hypothetical protein
MPGKHWTKEELDYLFEKVSYYPLPMLTEKLNNWHKRNGSETRRTINSVKVKLNREGYSVYPIDDNMNQEEWARQLGLKYHLNQWIRRGLLPFRRFNNSLTSVSKNDLKTFLLERPYLFKKANPEAIVYHFGEKALKLVQECVSPVGCGMDKIPIIRKDTGKVYPSIYKACKDLGLHRDSIHRELKRSDGWLRKYMG